MSTSSLLLLLLSVAAVNLLGAASPGPAFFIVSRTAVGQSRKAGLATAAGVSIATVIWAFGAIHGLALLMDKAAALFHVMQAAGAAFLIYLGWKAIRHAAEPLPPPPPDSAPAGLGAAFRRGFLVNMTNPKVAVFFASVFASVYGSGMPEWVNLVVLGVIAVDEMVWYTFVALAFSSRPAQAAYGRAKRWIDRAFGAFLALFGLRLLWSLRALA
jgi:threonine efflux protein